MAYVSSNPDDETLDEGGPLVPGGAPTPSAPTTGATGQAAGQKPKTSGRFADLGEYLRVNAPQQFGSQLAGKIGQDVDAAGNQLGQASNEFKSRADAGTVKDDQGLIGQVGTNPEGIDVGAYSKLKDASYGGPTNFSSSSDLYNQTTGQANAAESKANASKTEGGRFALLDSYYGKPQYSQGQKSLDNLLVQNDPNSQQAFKQIQDNARALQSNVAQTGNQLSAYGNQAKAATEATKNSARSALGIDDAGTATGTGALGDLKASVGNKLNAKQAEADRIASLAGNPDSLGQISPDLAAYLNSIGTSYGVDPRKYLSETAKESLTDRGVASQPDLARMKALTQLAGLDNSYDAEGAGQYADSPLYKFDKDNYADSVANAHRGYDTESSEYKNATGWLDNMIEHLKANPNGGQIASNATLPPGVTAFTGSNADALKNYAAQKAKIASDWDKLRGRYGFPSGGTIATGGITGGLR
jgi:hypothetical protein